MARRKSTVLLEHYLKQLKLPAVLREYESAAAVCSKENHSFETFCIGQMRHVYGFLKTSLGLNKL